MEVERTAAGGGPFSRHNVQEWSRLDQLTGLLEHARVETDHWTNSTSNSSHHFGKIVDSRHRNLADGGKEQRQQTKQLEVFQANIPGGSVQVIRSSTTSSFQTHKTLSNSGWAGTDRLALPSSVSQDFDKIKLAINPLDLSSQKSKVSIGRSGSIGSRRPPTRPRSLVGAKHEEVSEQTDGSALSELSRICHKVHEEAKSLSNGDQSEHSTNDLLQLTNTHSFRNSFNEVPVTKSSSDSTLSSHISLIRKKSCSSEDLHTVSEEGKETDSSGPVWQRSSKVRRSLQFPPKPSSTPKEAVVIPVTKSVAEIKKEIEARKQLVTNSFKTNQWNNFAELEGVLSNVDDKQVEEQSKDSSSSENGLISPTKVSVKRETFVTAESLKEVKGRLRKLSSPVDESLKNDDIDDGIVTEAKEPSAVENPDEIPKNSVKSYVFGMEVMLRKTKPPIIGTGSLESRSSNKAVTNGVNRSEEWYNRRKSYGFEQVSNQQNEYSSFDKHRMESSTDSGICKSSDTIPSWSKLTDKPTTQPNIVKTTHSIVIKPYNLETIKSNDVENDSVTHKGRKTVVNLTNSTYNNSWAWDSSHDSSSAKVEKSENTVKGKIAETIKSFNEKASLESQRLSEPITISIPVHQSVKSDRSEPTDLLLKQTKSISGVETSGSTSRKSVPSYSELLFGKPSEEERENDEKNTLDNIPWRGNRTKTLSNFFDSEFKRHSIAVDQTKYLTNRNAKDAYYFNGIHIKGDEAKNSTLMLAYNDDARGQTESDHEQSSNEKRHKKVEFCKTEVHFAAEPGRFNIVETDGKPPPSNMFRRRRRTTSEVPNKSGLPEIRFGDTQYEKTLLSANDQVSKSTENNLNKPLIFRSSPVVQEGESKSEPPPSSNAITKSESFDECSSTITESTKALQEQQNNSEDDLPKPKSILKNNIPKPKPYFLGEPQETTIPTATWGVKLKSVKPEIEVPKWQPDIQLPKETEFQKLLKTLKPAANKPPEPEAALRVEQSSTAADNGLEVRISSSSLMDNRRASWSVADRVRSNDDVKGFSTKVNFGPQETTVVDFASSNTSSGISHFSSLGVKNIWSSKEQHSSAFDSNPADEESTTRNTKRLIHSQSFNAASDKNSSEVSKDSFSRNVLKSTSLVLEIQNPTTGNNLVESDKKVSLKELSTNVVRDTARGKNCHQNNFSGKKPVGKNSYEVPSASPAKVDVTIIQSQKPIRNVDSSSNTVPPIRKTSSSTQTYFVNRRSSVKKESNQTTNIKINSSVDENTMNGIPGVLNALDDLSRCIDEVIIESPQRISKSKSTSSSSFKVREDFKREHNPQNILSVAGKQPKSINQLDLLREILDLGELSEDSLKADEEVRAYMSADNEDDTMSSEWSGSWSRVKTNKDNTRLKVHKDIPTRVSPSPRQGSEVTYLKPDQPQVTSISLHFDDHKWKSSPTTTATAVVPPINITSTAVIPTINIQETKHSPSFISRNFINAERSVSSKREITNSEGRLWRSSKISEDSSPAGNEPLSLQSLNQRAVDRLQSSDASQSPSRFSRSSQSPSKESMFLERTAERSIFLNENNRQKSSSPSSGTSRNIISTSTIKIDVDQKNPDKLSHSPRSFVSHSSKYSNYNSSSKTKVEEKLEPVKKTEIKKPVAEVKPKERKLSTGSSGRDGWLNTPKEVQPRKKSEPSIKKNEDKKQSKTSERVLKVTNLKSSQKRTESPIYQNREMYSERRDSNTETESVILEELTKAADQILLAVNGYTDDDSYRASSEDEYRKVRERTSQPLCTISELPTKKTNTNRTKLNSGVIKSTRSTDLRREYHSSTKTKIGKVSSNSSMESGSIDAKPLLSAEDRSKRRTARLLQRASSRELLFQAASSSEDINSGSDTGSLRAKRVYRRPRLQSGRHGGSKQDLSNSSESRTKERVQRTSSSGEAIKTQKKLTVESRSSRVSKTSAGGSGMERRERRQHAVVTQGSSTQKKKIETSQTQGKVNGIVCG